MLLSRRSAKGEFGWRTASEISAEIIVNAAGASAAELTPGLEIKKRKGHLVITDRYPGFVRHQLVELGYLKSAHSVSADSVAFNVQPRRTGQILIGSSRQYGAEHKEVDNSMLVRMLQRAQEYMPGLAQMSTVRTWTGFRAATPDKLPLIRAVDRRQDQYSWRPGMRAWESPHRLELRAFSPIRSPAQNRRSPSNRTCLRGP